MNAVKSNLSRLTNASRLCFSSKSSYIYWTHITLNVIQSYIFVFTIYLEWLSSSSASVTHVQDCRRSDLFTLEQRRQREKVGRIEKIEVRYLGLPNDTTMVMNRGLSTPFNCAQRKSVFLIVKLYRSDNENGLFFLDISESHCNRSALALIDGNIAWDMHRPLEDSCTIQLLNFQIADPHIVNRYTTILN